MIQDKDKLEFQENEIILNDIQSSYGADEPQIENPGQTSTLAFNDQVVTKASILKDYRSKKETSQNGLMEVLDANLIVIFVFVCINILPYVSDLTSSDS